MKHLYPWITLLSLVVLSVTPVRADEIATTIAKARAAVGSEDALKQIKSVRYTGTLFVPAHQERQVDKDGKVKMVDVAATTSNLDVMFQAPDRQRISVSSSTRSEITGLDGYSAWVQVDQPADPSFPKIYLLGADSVRRMRANTGENLAFFSNVGNDFGHVDDAGTVELNGQPARKLVFWHDDKIFFARWFDPITGQLLQTETDDGNTIHEAGQMLAGGLRLPKQIITAGKNADGTINSSTITFDSIKINEPMPDSFFAVPNLPPKANPALRPPPLDSGLLPLPVPAIQPVPSLSGPKNPPSSSVPPLLPVPNQK